MKTGKNLFTVFAVLMAAVVLSGCTDIPEPNTNIQFKEPTRFASYDEMAGAFEDARSGTWYGLGGMMIKGISTPVMMETATNAGADSARGSTDYSTTNIQVQGVDEADIVKSDGRYIYNFSKNRLIITDAYPIEDSQIVSKMELKGIYPQEMFVEGDSLLLFGNYTGEDVYFQGVMPYRPSYYGGRTIVQLYDISDRANPKVEKEIEFEGSYLNFPLHFLQCPGPSVFQAKTKDKDFLFTVRKGRQHFFHVFLQQLPRRLVIRRGTRIGNKIAQVTVFFIAYGSL